MAVLLLHLITICSQYNCYVFKMSLLCEAEMAAIRAQVDAAVERRGPPTPGDLVLLRLARTS